MSVDRASTIAKVQKLLNMTGEKGASENEIAVAMMMAHKLMDKHHLSEADLAAATDPIAALDNAEMDEFRSFVGKALSAWESGLASFVQKFVGGAKCYMDKELRVIREYGIVQFDPKTDEPRYGKSYVFFGVAEDAAIAKHLFDELRTLIATMATTRWGKVYKGEGASYCQGFVAGLFNHLKKAIVQEREQAKLPGNSTALMVMEKRSDLIEAKQDKADEWIRKEKGIHLRKGGGQAGSRVGFDHSAHSQGVVDGQNTDVSATRKKKLC